MYEPYAFYWVGMLAVMAGPVWLLGVLLGVVHFIRKRDVWAYILLGTNLFPVLATVFFLRADMTKVPKTPVTDAVIEVVFWAMTIVPVVTTGVAVVAGMLALAEKAIKWGRAHAHS